MLSTKCSGNRLILLPSKAPRPHHGEKRGAPQDPTLPRNPSQDPTRHSLGTPRGTGPPHGGHEGLRGGRRSRARCPHAAEVPRWEMTHFSLDQPQG